MTSNGDAAASQPEQKIFSLNVFETLDRTQNTHGVMHEDYHQYHQYCTNRLFRLRHAQPVRRELVHNSKYVEGVQMRRNAYCPRTKDPKDDEGEEATVTVIEHENHLWVPLYQAERAWAQSCEVQKQKRPSKTKQLVLRKLRKAVKFATALEEMSRTTCDDQTKEEIKSYLAWMKGNYALQKQDYSIALGAYRASMSALLTLAQDQQMKQDDPKSLVKADLWTTRAENVLRPLVRFCQYECKDTTPDLAMETSTAGADATKPKSEITISFRGKNVPLDPYKDLCVLYLKAEALQQQQQQSSEGDTSFLSLLSVYDDAIAFIEGELAQYEGIQAGPAVNAKKEELATLTGYFQYQKLNKSLHKNQDRLKDCHSDAERVHVYDALLQNAQAMAQIGVVAGGEADDEAQAHVLRIRALRCCSLAKVYLGTLQQPTQAKALWKQAKGLTKRAIEELAACDTHDKQHEEEIDRYLEELEELQKIDLAALEVRLKAALFLRNSGQSAGFTVGTDRPLWLRLEEFDPGTSGAPLVDDPPRAIPIPAKPVFYDIAWKYAGGNFPLDELDEEIEKLQPKQTGGGGLFGWLTGSK